MKFTTSEAAKKIRTMLTKGGKTCFMSERSINEQVDTLMKLLVNDETELDDFIAQIEPTFKTMNGNVQNEQSEFVKKWNEEHPLPTPEPTPNPVEPKPTESAEFAALKAEFESLKAEREAEKKARTLTEKKNELIAKLKEKGVNDEEWISLQMSKFSVSDDTDIENESNDFLTLYNKGKANVRPTPTPDTPRGGENSDYDSLADVSKMAKQKRESEEQRFK
jgi:hypothetical protein